jgi:hypothetical protein
MRVDLLGNWQVDTNEGYWRMVLHRAENLARKRYQFRKLAPVREHQAVLTSILVRIQGPSPIRVHQEDLTSNPQGYSRFESWLPHHFCGEVAKLADAPVQGTGRKALRLSNSVADQNLRLLLRFAGYRGMVPHHHFQDGRKVPVSLTRSCKGAPSGTHKLPVRIGNPAPWRMF